MSGAPGDYWMLRPLQPLLSGTTRRGPPAPASHRWTNVGSSRSLEETMMREIVASLFLSLDGVYEAPERCHFPYFADELGATVRGQIGAADAMLLGRVARRGGRCGGRDAHRPAERAASAPL